MTEPGTSSLGKTERCPSPSLTSGLTWSAGMKSCTGRGHGAGVGTGEEAEATCVSRPGPGLTDPAGSLCFPPSATRCSWRARCGGKAWGSSSYRFCSSWPTGGVCVCVRLPLLGGAASAVLLGGGWWGQGSQECSGRRVSRTSLPCHDSTFGAVG